MYEYTSRSRVWGLTCPGFPEEVSRARRWTRDILGGSPHARDAELIVSELGANAVLHTASGDPSGSFHLSLVVSARMIALSVTDAGGTASTPRIEHPNPDAVHGRGLGMVGALAHGVVIHEGQDGRTITAELVTDSHPDEHPR